MLGEPSPCIYIYTCVRRDGLRTRVERNVRVCLCVRSRVFLSHRPRCVGIHGIVYRYNNNNNIHVYNSSGDLVGGKKRRKKEWKKNLPRRRRLRSTAIARRGWNIILLLRSRYTTAARRTANNNRRRPTIGTANDILLLYRIIYNNNI